jgi:hypothetical protein
VPINPTQSWVDESHDQRIFTHAGFIGDAEQWARFSTEWSRRLKESPSIRWLKMDDAKGFNGEFYQWSPEERDKKIAWLLEVVEMYPPLSAIHITIDIETFRKIWAPQLIKPFANEYYMALVQLTCGVCMEVKSLGREVSPIEPIFDNHDIYREKVKKWYPVVRSMLKTGFGELHALLPPDVLFRDDKIFAPLQLADVAAFLFRLSASGKPSEFGWVARAIEPHVPLSQYSVTFDADAIRSIAVRASLKKQPTIEETIAMLAAHGVRANKKMLTKKKQGNDKT